MQILVANDDGIYAPGLWAMAQALSKIGDVTVVAPATEQSGVGHAITFLTPLVVKDVFLDDARHGFAVEGSPADCIRLGVARLCKTRPDLVVSGINSGQNAGVNVLYSGTVAAAIEGVFFGITSFAVSLQYNDHFQFDRAAEMALGLIEQTLKQKSAEPTLFNINIPTTAIDHPKGVQVVPMSTASWDEEFEMRRDPRGRKYYWSTGSPGECLAGEPTDISSLAEGYVTMTPLQFDMTKRAMLPEMRNWDFRIS